MNTETHSTIIDAEKLTPEQLYERLSKGFDPILIRHSN